MAQKSSLQKLLDFLDRLEDEGLWYHLTHSRPETICVFIDIPGERWEVEFFADGHIEFERFRSSGDLEDESVLEQFMKLYTKESGE
ncbi:MAG: hypothetical protein HY862_04330 [Chloroflexi bacterium]|nr:hypothetical protein [Chloroflexota bacterium]